MDKLINYLGQCIRPNDKTEFYVSKDFDDNIFDKLIQDGIMITNDKPNDEIIKKKQIEYILINDIYISRKLYKDLHWLNEDGTITFTLNQEPIYRRLTPPPYETVNHTFIIKSLISYINSYNKKGTYIEYGVRCGNNLKEISEVVEYSYGIDILNRPSCLNDNIKFFRGFTDEFSKNLLPFINFNFAFIDADHKFESCLKDFDNIFKYIQKDGLIFLHDTYPTLEEMLSPIYCNDCYKTPLEIKKKYTNLELITFPLNPGLTVIRKL
jgi:hypothetical protein